MKKLMPLAVPFFHLAAWMSAAHFNIDVGILPGCDVFTSTHLQLRVGLCRHRPWEVGPMAADYTYQLEVHRGYLYAMVSHRRWLPRCDQHIVAPSSSRNSVMIEEGQ